MHLPAKHAKYNLYPNLMNLLTLWISYRAFKYHLHPHNNKGSIRLTNYVATMMKHQIEKKDEENSNH